MLSVTLGVGLSCAAVSPVFVTLGQVSEGLVAPGAIDVDDAGNLYVADARQGGLFWYDIYGRLKGSYQQIPVSGRGLAVSSDGLFLYASTASGVVRLDPQTGNLLTLIGAAESSAPVGLAGPLAVDFDGAVYVADLLSLQVLVYSQEGSLLRRIGEQGTGPAKFSSIDAVAIAGDRLLVADGSATNLKIDVFSLDGSYLRSLSTETGFGPIALSVPRGIVVDHQNRLYFLEFIRSEIRILDGETYAYAGTFSQPGKSVGQLEYVKGLAFDPANRRLFVACDGGRVEIFGIDGGTTPVFVNHAPTAALPQSPVGRSAVATFVPELTFAAATDEDGDALRYQVRVLNGGAPVFEQETTATVASVGAGVLAENSVYTWTVQAFDAEGAGSGISSAAFVVNTVNEAPQAPVLVAPLSGEVLAGAGVLSWETTTDPDPVATQLSYRVEVAADATFSPVVLSGTFSGTSAVLRDFAGYAGLVDGDSYVWRVTALDGEGAASAPGAVGHFVYDTTVLKVTANMPGAVVSLDGNHVYAGRVMDVAPLELRDLKPGKFSVVVERDGFEPYVTQVNLVANGNVEINARLIAALVPGTFRLTSTLPASVSGAAAPFVVDFDNDGRLDLLVGDTAGQLRLYAGMQRSATNVFTFTSSRSLGLPVMPAAVPFVADWDNDGRKDLLVGQADGTVKLYLNEGTEAVPVFGEAQYVTANGSVLNAGKNAAPAVVDLDGNGAKDLVVGNGFGQLKVYWNQGSDAEPQLAAGAALFAVTGAAVPMPVDWDADGDRDLLVTAAGVVKAYLNNLAGTGGFAAVPVVSQTRFASVFPLNFDGIKGKDLLIGQTDNRLTYWAGGSLTYVASLKPSLLDKMTQIEGLVAAAEPARLSQVATIRSYVELGKYDLAQYYAKTLAGQLQDVAAKAAVNELVVILTK